VNEVTFPSLSPERFEDVLSAERATAFADTLHRARRVLEGRTIWHVNSTEQGGGVAEMLQSLLGYLLGAGINTRRLVVDGNEAFFELTKRIHYLLHGEPGDHGDLHPHDKAVYEGALAADLERIVELVRPGDPVVLHDPQTLGLAPALRAEGARVIWSCHIGADEPNAHTKAAWQFLHPYVEQTEAQGFSRTQHVWPSLDRSTVAIIPPCLDAFSPKNQPLASDTVDAILATASVIPAERDAPAAFARQDGARGTISTQVQMIEDGRLPSGAPIVTQISRWDRLKDHAGVMAGFVRHVPPDTGAHLVLAGPAPDSVGDDPDGKETFAELRTAWEALEARQRQRIHLACLPMKDVEENAAVVNALQRRSDVIVQKSLAEGFGLTVAEAMWKARPTIGSKVGGIQDQIEDGRSGLLINDPLDLAALGHAVTTLLADRDASAKLGLAARQRVIDEYLAPCYLSRYLRLIDNLLATYG
jgi:trehalose synthase